MLLLYPIGAGLVHAAVAWPLDTCFCEEQHNQYVENTPACPDNQTVQVSQNGGNGTISFQQFLNAVEDADSTTYVIEKSASPYVMGCRQVTIGRWNSTQKRICVVIRGETGNREDVIIVGADPAVDPDFWKSAEYGGPSSCGIGQVIQIANAENITIADLTMRNFAGKMLKVDGGDDGGTPWAPKNIRFHNLDLWDCGSQMIKGAGEPVSSRDGILECSYLHYTTGLFPQSTYETQGIDIHEGRNWIIRDNHFENFRQETGKSGLGSAILMWDNSDTVLSERNLIVNCNFAIKYGASWYNDGSDNMLARNNLIIWDEASPQWVGDNVFEIGLSVSNGGIFHNTIWNPVWQSGNAFTVCSNNYRIENNIYINGTTHRCGSQTNNLAGDATWFLDVSNYDFHLVQNHVVPLVSSVPEDIEGKQRPVANPSAGAFEFNPMRIFQGAALEKTNGLIMRNLGRFISISLSNPGGINNAILRMRDVRGQLVFEKTMHNNSTPVVFPISELANGLYFFQYKAKEINLIKKAIIIR